MGQSYSSVGPSKIYGRQPLKNLKGYGLLKHLLVQDSVKEDIIIIFGKF